MPLVMMCGLPSSGKTQRSNELAEYLRSKHNIRVSILGDAQEGIDKNVVFSNSYKEKELRGTLKSSVQRILNKDEVVILDSSNYIKGFRYELFCVCKTARTTLCVVHCDVTLDGAIEFNNTRPELDRYKDDLITALHMRFEPPNSQNRWDSPLFIVRPSEELPLEDIHNALFLKNAPPPNQSTQSQPLSATNYLHELDKTTQQIVSHIMTEQRLFVAGESITIPGAAEKLTLSRKVNLGELQRCRRQFITFTKSQVINDPGKLAIMFVVYLNKSLD